MLRLLVWAGCIGQRLYRKAVGCVQIFANHCFGNGPYRWFSGETDKNLMSHEFCRQMGFSKMHVFRYSKRPGTPAATAPNQVDQK